MRLYSATLGVKKITSEPWLINMNEYTVLLDSCHNTAVEWSLEVELIDY